MVHDTALVDEGATIGEGTRIWHWVHVCGGARIGSGCVLGQGVYVGPHAQIGDRVRIQNNVSVFEGVVLEDDVFCGPSVVFTNVINPRAFIERKSEFKSTTICRGASIGANATIVCGVTVGRYALVGAGAVVAHDVGDHELVAGVPARRLGWVSRAGVRLRFDEAGNGVCPETGEAYRLFDDRLVPQGDSV